ELDVARGRLDLDRPKAAATLDVGRAGFRLDARALGALNRDEHLGVAEQPAPADVDHDLVTVAALVHLDPRALDRLLARVVVAQRLQLQRRLVCRGRLAADPRRAHAGV